MLGEKELQKIQENLRTHFPLLVDAATAITDQDISNYPVFVIFRMTDDSGIGLPVIAGNDANANWSVNLTTLEELASKQVVDMANVERFTAVYKTHTDSLCCLIYHAGKAQFVFMPVSTEAQ